MYKSTHHPVHTILSLTRVWRASWVPWVANDVRRWRNPPPQSRGGLFFFKCFFFLIKKLHFQCKKQNWVFFFIEWTKKLHWFEWNCVVFSPALNWTDFPPLSFWTELKRTSFLVLGYFWLNTITWIFEFSCFHCFWSWLLSLILIICWW